MSTDQIEKYALMFIMLVWIVVLGPSMCDGQRENIQTHAALVGKVDQLQASIDKLRVEVAAK